jgi:hypothetical protein
VAARLIAETCPHRVYSPAFPPALHTVYRFKTTLVKLYRIQFENYGPVAGSIADPDNF